jgi:hypothetical protein
MEEFSVRPDEARAALASVHDRQAGVIAGTRIPDRFWAGTAGLMVELTAAVESGRPAVRVIGAVVFAAGLAALVGWVVRRTPARTRPALVGPYGVLVILGFALVTAGAGVAAGLLWQHAGLAFPATVGMLVAGGVLVAGGPRLVRRLGRDMAARAGEGR